jgi:GNAT superfamily N-acetyltransferase
VEFFYEPNPDPVELQRLENRLLRFNADIISGYGYDDFIHKAVAASGALAAAIHGQIGGGWLYVAGLWVAARHRGRGLGTQLLTMAESTAVAADCRGAYLYTYSFQAPDF